MPDCSVVVIAYNDAARLPRAVRSVLGQSLRNVEVIIADDASTDDTEQVARQLMAEDSRVRYLRRKVNSGGCGAPRNDGIDAALSPYIMFLDSDDRLTRHACKSLLTEIERTGAQFVSGQISRFYEATGKQQRYYPSLFAPRRVVEGIEAEPELFVDSFTTNKLYDVAFLRSKALRFPEGVHFEDHVFAAELYSVATRFAVVPWVIYLWHRAADDTSISLSHSEMTNVRQRIGAAFAADRILADHGLSHLVPERQHRFLRQDLPVYLHPLPSREEVWVKEFASVVRPYLATVPQEVFDRTDPMVKVCAQLILDERVEDLTVAARSLTGPHAPPRQATQQNGRTYWGTSVGPGTDITALRLAELPYTASRLRHEVTDLASDGRRVTMTVRTYDPFGALPTDWKAFIRLGATKVAIEPRPSGDGCYISEITFVPAKGGDPRIGFTRLSDGRTTTDRLLVDPRVEPVRVGEITVRPEGRAAILRVSAPPRRPSLLRRTAKKLLKRWSTPAMKLKVYKVLIRVLPRKKDLALFESDCGKGYTGSPRALYEELRRRGLPVAVVWSAARNRDTFPKDAGIVRRSSWRYIWTMARAAYWVDSHGFPLDYPKPRGTRYLQTWHGQGIKSIGFDAPDLRADFAQPRDQWREAIARWDALVSPGAEFERIFVTANRYAGPLLRYGTPRCDALVRGQTPEGVRERLEIPPGKKVLLYAPTYRDAAKFSGRSVRVDLDLLAEELADEWVLVLRTHPVEKYKVPQRVRHFVRPAGSYPEINDLMLISDALLTDYSSVSSDYAVTGKPMLFYIDDWDDYRRNERGVYHDLPSIAPGPCLSTTEELVTALRDLPAVHRAHAQRYAAWRQLWCADERGNAAARVVDDFFAGPLAQPAVGGGYLWGTR
ncbi:CDP-glycerol glycerophosphotransferase family protein [Nonomuraea sp. NPDC050663]|uniref:bifunctional glycosyltransferase/CDP-glycerol:glycerophosphate glycerophosphotransferase n=1 Tax=Nonomuraea sp. NPDC050663 TaxID=3364370 RepID=UPI003796E847